MLRVIRNHRRAAYGQTDGYEKLSIAARAARPRELPRPAAGRGGQARLGSRHRARPERTASATRRRPSSRRPAPSASSWTATRPGIEPDFALVKFKKLAGGGYFKIINQAVPEALRTLGYRESEIAEIEAYAVGHGSLAQAPAINHATLKAKGFTDEALAKVEAGLGTRLRHQVRVQQVDARRGVPDRHAQGPGRQASTIPRSTCSPTSASPRRTSRPPTSTSAAR